MRSVRERLQGLGVQSASPVPQDKPENPLASLVPGRLESGPNGSFLVVEHRRTIPADLTASLDRGFDLLPLIGQPGCGAARLHDFVFLDVEATGLSGGAGSHAFLVGLGYFEGHEFVVRQSFLRSPIDEPAMLAHLRTALADYSILASFNGKTFDWPLLESRLILHGHRYQPTFLHLDLLHPARRVWRDRLGSCSLASLESAILGVRRSGDVPSFLIPQIYFQYLRGGDPRPLRAVFRHNHLDIVALMRVTKLLLDAATAPVEALPDPADRAAFGRLLLSRGAVEQARPLLVAALADDRLPSTLRIQCAMDLWSVAKRAGAADSEVPTLTLACRIASQARPPDIAPLVELAKHLEHRRRDIERAILAVERALRLIELGGAERGRNLLVQRLERLHGKRRRQDRMAEEGT